MESEIDNMEMAKILVGLRGMKTQEEVARELGISKSALAMYETGKRVPRDTIKMKMSKYYQRSITYIFFNEKGHKM